MYDRPLAHRLLFRHRHPNQTPDFHDEMIREFHSEESQLCWIAFRGSAKSTRMEEAVVLQALFQEFDHCIIAGASADKARERLLSIRREFEKNIKLLDIFGDQRGTPWEEDRLELKNGVTIRCIGKGQALRGTKTEDKRPDLIICDDIETRDSLSTPETRDKIQNWFWSELLPAGDEPTQRVRVLCNDMHYECLGNRLKDPDSGFKVRVYPWESIGPDGERVPIWPDRYPLSVIDKKRKQMFSQGKSIQYDQEYMCRSDPEGTHTFNAEMFTIEPRQRTWQAIYAMIDPARTVNRKSASTGYAVWSWVNSRLIVWDAGAKMLLPDEIVRLVFSIDDEFHPVWTGVEEDGLNEFLMQPIRQEQVRRGGTVPVRAVRAPKGKLDFIRSLQPYFSAREVTFAKDLPELRKQLLGFPNGLIDAPNALAYAVRLRPGAPMYEDFTMGHVAEDLSVGRQAPPWLCLNATRAYTTAILAQLVAGTIRIYADWVVEGEVSAVLSNIVTEANMEAGRAVRLVCPPSHFDKFHNVGLVQAANRIPMEIRQGMGPERGRVDLRAKLQSQVRGMPALLCSSRARWTLNGFSGGYSRVLLKQGILADYAEEGQYRVLMEGLESFAGMSGIGETLDENRNWQTAPDGRRFVSALATRR
jgi:hypothetical protein